MTYLIDTDYVADYLRVRPDVHKTLQALRPDGIAISLITYGEILDGVYYGRNPEENERIFRQFLPVVPVLPLNRRMMQRFAHIRGDLRRRGQIIGDPDILIAATALYHSLTLVTRNHDHFQRVPGLTLY